MQTIELLITKNKKSKEILKTLRDKRLKRGDMVRLKTIENNSSFLLPIIVCLLIIVWYFSETKKKTFGEEVEDILFNNKMSLSELEKQIEKEFGVAVEIEQQNTEEKMWKDFSAQNFLKGYANDEPEYTLSDVKEPNPTYKKWKKGK